MGNIDSDEKLADLISDAFERKSFFRKTKEHECENCDFWAGCRGGCSSAVKYRNDPSLKIDAITCSVNKFIYPELIELILNRPDIIGHFIRTEVCFIN